jgi:hypothetical protein
MSNKAVIKQAEEVDIFAETQRNQKERIIRHYGTLLEMLLVISLYTILIYTLRETLFRPVILLV